MSEEEYDPFAAFDHSTGSGLIRDPYSPLAELRAASPVLEGRIDEALGLPRAPEGEGPESGLYFSALGYDAVAKVLLDGETFSSAGYAKSMGLVMGHSILEMDEPEHRRYRDLLQQAFTLKAMGRWERDVVRPIVEKRVDAILAKGRGELVHDLTFPFPLEVIAAMLGLPEEDLPAFHRMAVELISIAVDIERGLKASQDLRDYFARILAARRAEPRDDMISMLAQAELDGVRLEDEDIFAFLRLLLPAGAETTYRSSSNLLFGLLTDPEQLELLREDRSLMRRAIEEGLRWEAPLTGIARTTTCDVVLEGVEIPKGSSIMVSVGSANHDPQRWSDPERFDIRREVRPHIAFATGAHTCLGLHLARMETSVVINELLDRLPGLRMDPEAKDPHITGLTFRAPRELPVLFDV